MTEDYVTPKIKLSFFGEFRTVLYVNVFHTNIEVFLGNFREFRIKIAKFNFFGDPRGMHPS